MALKIPVSFGEKEIDIYNYIKSKRNYSVYIKDLVEADMNKNNSIGKMHEGNKNLRNNNNDNDLGIEF